jgi:2-C-methyl-D-erythritol 4-phosphate cytidylyltransferase
VYTLLLLNGGVGSRVAQDRPKQFLHVNGMPILVYALVAADACDDISQIVINYPDDWRDETERVARDYAIRTPLTYVPGGVSRHDSVARMLPYCENDRVIVHESARPLVTSDDFARIIAHPRDNASFMLEIPFTVAPVEPATGRVTGALDRSRLRNVQLPQKFDKDTLVAAHAFAEREGLTFTEDATLCAAAGFEVWFLNGSDRNFKVTTYTDVRLANYLLGSESASE